MTNSKTRVRFVYVLAEILHDDFLSEIKYLFNLADCLKLAEKLSVIRTDSHKDLVRPKNILPVRKKSPKKFSHMHNVLFGLFRVIYPSISYWAPAFTSGFYRG